MYSIIKFRIESPGILKSIQLSVAKILQNPVLYSRSCLGYVFCLRAAGLGVLSMGMMGVWVHGVFEEDVCSENRIGGIYTSLNVWQ